MIRHELTDAQLTHIREQFGAALRECREFAGTTQAEFGEDLGVASSTVSGWEKGRSMPASRNLYKLCRWMGISIDYLFGGSKDRHTEMKHARAKARA